MTRKERWSIDTIEMIGFLCPEMIDLLERRYNILRTVNQHEPVGRRMLAELLGLGERVVRGELDFLKSRQLLLADANGVALTPECAALLPSLGGFVHRLRGLAALEAYLAERMGLSRVCIVPGDIDLNQELLIELGKVAGRFVRDAVKDDWIVAVTGGTTMAETARNIPPGSLKNRVLVVPARGGLGEDVEIQANTIVADMARRLGASYRLLHVPDGLGEEAYAKLLEERRVQEVVSLGKRADLLIHGIGVPQVMAAIRDLNWDDLVRLAAKPMVGEACNIYFAADGSPALETPTVGPCLEDLARVELVVAVAGGHSKAEAILAVVKSGFIDVLITDQGAAEVMRSKIQ